MYVLRPILRKSQTPIKKCREFPSSSWVLGVVEIKPKSQRRIISKIPGQNCRKVLITKLGQKTLTPKLGSKTLEVKLSNLKGKFLQLLKKRKNPKNEIFIPQSLRKTKQKKTALVLP